MENIVAQLLLQVVFTYIIMENIIVARKLKLQLVRVFFVIPYTLILLSYRREERQMFASRQSKFQTKFWPHYPFLLKICLSTKKYLTPCTVSKQLPLAIPFFLACVDLGALFLQVSSPLTGKHVHHGWM